MILIPNTLLVKRLLISAFAYFIAGALALSLSNPPGYAAPFWPAAGISMACTLLWGYRILPGIFLGSIFSTLFTTIKNIEAFDPLLPLFIALGLAVGATLQAACGAYLVKKAIKMPSRLDNEFDLAKTLLIGGPLTCIISATIGVFTLFLAKILPLHVITYNWFAWWAGDVLGAIIIFPIFIILSSKEVSLNRKLSITIPSLFLFSIAISLFIYVKNAEYKVQYELFQKIVSKNIKNLQTHLNATKDLLSSIKALHAASSNFSREYFRIFTQQSVLGRKGILLIEWAPRISKVERETFEKQSRLNGFVDFKIWENTSNKHLESPIKDEYFPILYAEPFHKGKYFIGYDVASDKTRLASLNRARNATKQIASAPINLLRKKELEYSFLLIQPIYQRHIQLDKNNNNLGQLSGFVLGVFSIKDLITSILKDEKNDFYIKAEDIDPLGNRTLIHEDLKLSPPLFSWVHPIQILDRIWKLTFEPTDAFFLSHQKWQAWLVITSSLLFASVSSALLIIITAKNRPSKNSLNTKNQNLIKDKILTRSIVEALSESLITTDHEGSIILFNPAAQKLFGYSKYEVIGQNINRLIPDLGKSYASGKFLISCVENTSYKMNGYRKSNKEIFLDISTKTFKANGKVLLSCLIHDATTNKELKQLKKEFLTTVNHELRNPLATVVGALRLLLSSTGENFGEEAQKLLNLSYENSKRLEHIIDDILAIEKIDAHKFQFNMEVEEICDLLKTIVKDHEIFATKHGVKFSMQTKVKKTYARLDKKQFSHALGDILKNLAKHTAAMETIHINLLEDNLESIRIEISNLSSGIPKEFQEQLIRKEPLSSYTSDSSTIDLKVVKKIINCFEGEIGIDIRKGKKTSLYITIPRYKENWDWIKN